MRSRTLVVAALVGLLAVTSVTTACAAAPDAQGEAAVGPVLASRQTAEQVDQSLATLRRVDGLPMYEMNYVGDYDPMSGVAVSSSPSPFGCSLFVAPGASGGVVAPGASGGVVAPGASGGVVAPGASGAGPLFGRNFDWDPHAALVLHTAPRHGYASVSIVDISYLSIEPGTDLRTDQQARHRLLNAPMLPFDGMNEKGLAIGLAADNSGFAKVEPGRPTVGGVRVIRLMLDQAATVDEALAVLGRYSVDFSGGPPLHYLIADAHGASAVVEFVDGALTVVRGTGGRQVLTNIRLAGTPESARREDTRYRTASDEIAKFADQLDWRRAMSILHSVAQGHTRWSVVYELATGSAHLVAGQQWATVHEFNLRFGA